MINQLVANIKKTGAPIVVGLDPMLNYIPEQVQQKAFAEYGMWQTARLPGRVGRN